MSKCKLPGCFLPCYTGFEFCGKRHGIIYQQLLEAEQAPPPTTTTLPTVSPPLNPPTPTTNISSPVTGVTPVPPSYAPNPPSPSTINSFNNAPSVSNANICKLPGCTRTCYTGFDYCGKRHGAEHKRQLDSTAIVMQAFTIASQPSKPARGDVTVLDSNSVEFTSIRDQFHTKWLHQKAKPTVLHIAKIHVADRLQKRWDAYRERVHNDGVTVFGSGSKGNTHRRFHGTIQACRLGFPGNNNTCSDSECRVCSIIKSGWLLSKAKSNFGWGRFGAGIYFTSTSSKSDDYNNNTKIGGKMKSMFVVHLVIGKGYKTKEDMQNLTDPPNGCHSVLGEVSTTGSLNFDEVVVYNSDACLPMYLVIYQ